MIMWRIAASAMRDVLFGDAVLVELPGDQIALRDAEFFFLGVAGNLDDLHAVAQGGQNGVHQVGRRDKHHFRSGRTARPR